MVYLITYDLNTTGKDYAGVYQAIKDSAVSWCHYWDSSWLIKSNLKSASDVFQKIEPHLDRNDRCLVIEVTNNKQGWLSKKQWDSINTDIFG